MQTGRTLLAHFDQLNSSPAWGSTGQMEGGKENKGKKNISKSMTNLPYIGQVEDERDGRWGGTV